MHVPQCRSEEGLLLAIPPWSPAEHIAGPCANGDSC